METFFFLRLSQPQFLVIFFLLPWLWLWLWLWLLRRATPPEPPQPGGALPIIGHMLLLRRREPLPQVLSPIADALGPVLLLRLGSRRVLVISSPSAARECLSSLDEVFATRPLTPAGDLMGYGHAMMGFAPYGPYWRALRRLASSHLLSKPRVASLRDLRAAEIGVCVRDLHRRKGAVNMKEWLGHVTFNVVVRAVAGKRYFCEGGSFSEEGWVFRRAISRLFRLMKTMVVSDMLPYLRWLDPWGHDAAMKEAFSDIDAVVSGWLEEHRRRRQDKDGEETDLMDTILDKIEDSGLLEMRDADTVVKALSMSMILGATDTTTNSLTLTLAALLNHPDVLSKIRAELDDHVGDERIVDESDIKNLVYLRAAVKEAFRLYPTSQFLQPHEAMQDCTVGGFHVRAGTRLLVNVWKLQRDPSVWEDPLVFRPERFLARHAHVEVRGQNLELIPFGSGRRSCPGIAFGLHVMHMTLARLVHEFDMRTADGKKVEMSPGLGSTLDPTPLNVVLTARLPPHLHG